MRDKDVRRAICECPYRGARLSAQPPMGAPVGEQSEAG